jgi:hypothetical protein
MTALPNPFRVGSRGWGTLIHQNHAAGEENGSIMVRMFVSLCLASKKSSEREFFVPAGTHVGVKLLIHLWIRLFFVIDAFLSHGIIVGVLIFTWGRIWGNNICRGVTKFEITVLELPKLQKTIPRYG